MPPKKNAPAKKVSAPLRMSEEMLEKVAEASRRTGLAQADILRMALAIGLEDLRRVNYDLPSVISDAARGEPSPKLELLDKVAEEETPYRYKNKG